MTDRIQRELDLDQPSETVWSALTDPDWLSAWLAEEVEIELRPGGAARFVIDGVPRTGWVEEVLVPRGDEPGRLTFWWQGEDEPASRVELRLEPTPTGSRLRVTEDQPLEVLDLVGAQFDDLGGFAPGPLLTAACA